MATAAASNYSTLPGHASVHLLPVPIPMAVPVPVPVHMPIDSAGAPTAEPAKGKPHRGEAWAAQFDAMDLELRTCVEEDTEGADSTSSGRRAPLSRPGRPVLPTDRSRLGVPPLPVDRSRLGVHALRPGQRCNSGSGGAAGDDEFLARRLQTEADAELARHMEQSATGGPARRPTWWRQQAAEMAATASVAQQPEWWRQQAAVIGLGRTAPSTRGDEALARQLQDEDNAGIDRGRRRDDRNMRRAWLASLEQPTRFAAPAASARVVDSATTIMSYREDTSGSDQGSKTCAICCDEFDVGVQVRLLPCLHMYHVGCIDRWLAQSRTCPVCKHEIVG